MSRNRHAFCKKPPGVDFTPGGFQYCFRNGQPLTTFYPLGLPVSISLTIFS